MIQKLFFYFFICFLFVSSCVFFYIEYNKIFPSSYRITFFDIELGDSVLVQTPEGKNILIDTGSGTDIISKLSGAMSFFSKNIDILVITHGDSDHIGGVRDVFARYNVENVFFTGASKKALMFQELLQTIEEQKISWRIMESKKDYLIDSEFIVDVLYPLQNISFLQDHGNNESFVFFLSLFRNKILFTGDMEKESEDILLKEGEDLHADILKVPHHGSKTSSSLSFIQAVNPRVAIAQAAIKNKFGHPHNMIVERYESLGVQFLQTGKEGDITFCISQKNPVFLRC